MVNLKKCMKCKNGCIINSKSVDERNVVMYEYKFVRMDQMNRLNADFEKCKAEIEKHANDGWRFVQIVMLPNDKLGVYRPASYEIIFERAV